MIESAKHLSGLFEVNAMLVKRAIQDLTEEEVRKRPSDSTNSMLWIIGHLTAARYGICAFLGRQLEHPFGNQFDRGSEHSDAKTYPALRELLEKWDEVSDELQTALDQADESRWLSPVQREFPGVDRTVGGGVSFLHFHESYHVGQLAYVRRLLGHSQLVG